MGVTNLNIFRYSGYWSYQAGAAPHASCTGPVSAVHTTLSGLASGTTYTYTAYDHNTCDSDALTPAVTFTTLPQCNGSPYPTWHPPRPR